MKKSLELIILSVFFLSQMTVMSQVEKRLALVIGNANYLNNELNNPVNDALLMAKTLESLNFDVILDTNISNIAQFKKTVRIFGEQRSKYDVGFIYYAGHGVQINNINYLLATKEKYLTEYDVEDNALSVQKIMRFLTNQTNQVNVLILDACRDNPFEINWNPKTRSNGGGRGLVKISAPTGSLIAYSTDAGNTAADGEGLNSIYCLSLVKNMKIENVSLDQVFRNVRSDVLKATNSLQRPVESSQLTGEPFFLLKKSFDSEFFLIDSCIKAEDYICALEGISIILSQDSKNKKALLKRTRIYSHLNDDKSVLNSFNTYKKKFPNDPNVYYEQGRYYYENDAFEEALNNLNKCISIDGNKSSFYTLRGLVYKDLGDFFLAEKDYLKAIEIEPENYVRYFQISDFYKNTEDISKAIEAISKAIEINSNDDFLWSVRAVYYHDNGQVSEAEQDFSSAIELNTNANNLYYRADFYVDLNKMSLAISDLEKAHEIDPTEIDVLNLLGYAYLVIKDTVMALKMFSIGVNIDSLPQFSLSDLKTSRTYSLLQRAHIYENQGKNELADSDYLRAIKIDPENDQIYQDRSHFLQRIGENTKALINISKSIELNNNADNLFYRAKIYNEIGENQLAINDLENALEVDSNEIDALALLGKLYLKQSDTASAIESFSRGIKIDRLSEFSTSDLISSKSRCYIGRGFIFSVQGKNIKAELDYAKAIAIEPINYRNYFERGQMYSQMEEHKKAVADYSQAIKLNPSAEVLYHRAAEYFSLGEFKLAEIDFEKCQKLLKENQLSEFYSERGYFYTEISNIKKAIKDFDLAIKLDPSYAPAYQNRVLLHLKNNDFSKALKDSYKAIEIDKNDPQNYYYLGYLYSVDSQYLKSAIYYNLAQDKIGGEDEYYIQGYNYERIEKWSVHFTLGEIYKKLDNDQMACEEFKKAIEFAPRQIWDIEIRKNYVKLIKKYCGCYDSNSICRLKEFLGEHSVKKIQDFSFVNNEWVLNNETSGSIFFSSNVIYFKRFGDTEKYRAIEFNKENNSTEFFNFDSEYGGGYIEKDFKKVVFFDSNDDKKKYVYILGE